MASARQPSSFKRVQAVLLKPCGVTSRLENPKEARAVASRVPEMGRSGLPWAGKRNRPLPVSDSKCSMSSSVWRASGTMCGVLHALGGDAPLRTLEVDLAPFGAAQLPGPHEEKRSELEGDRDHLGLPVSIDGAQQLA